jgi:hypothetical protein
MRYGENILEVLKNPEWVCPICRDICNCSFCRQKKGWAPTGILHRYAKSQGYRSTAHYLILSQKSSAKAESAGVVSDNCYLAEDKDDASPNGARRSLTFSSASETTTESNSLMEITKEENDSLPNLASPKSEFGSDFQMKLGPSISHANNSHGDILVPSKTSLDSSECRDKQCDFGDVEIIEITDMDDHSKCKTKKISSKSKGYVRGGIAQCLRPRVVTRASS